MHLLWLVYFAKKLCCRHTKKRRLLIFRYPMWRDVAYKTLTAEVLHVDCTFCYLQPSLMANVLLLSFKIAVHDDVIKWKHFPRYWPFVRGIHRSPVNSQHKGQWRGAMIFSLICAWMNDWVNNREAGDLRRHRAHYDVIVMYQAVAVFYEGPHRIPCDLRYTAR